MPAWPYEIPLRYNVALRQHADFVISNDTFDEILSKVFELLYFPMNVTKIFVGNYMYGN